MNVSIELTPENYVQPDNWLERTLLQDGLEQISYAPKSHVRIWYNTQMEGYPMHHHAALEIVIPKHRGYTVTANQRTFALEEGDILFIPPHMLHEIQEPTDGSRFIYQIEIDFLNTLQDFKALYPISMEPYLCTASAFPRVYPAVLDGLKRMSHIYFSRPPLWETRIYSLLLECICAIGQDYYGSGGERENIPVEKRSEYYQRFTALLNYIDSHYTEELTLDQVANQMGFSKYHFSRLFKQYVNVTFYSYLCRKRVNAAQSLLSTPMSITDIAFRTGFNNLTTFCRCFKKYTNCSPTEYRGKLRNENPL